MVCWCRNAGFRASKRAAGAALRARGVCIPFGRFRWPTKEAFVLRTDVAFAALASWEARSRRVGRRLARHWWVETAWAACEARSEAWAAWGAGSDVAWEACQATVVRLVGWLGGWLVGWLDGWLVGWLVSW